MLQSITQAEGHQNIVRYFTELGWAGVAYELRHLIGLFFAIIAVLALTHFILDRLER